MTRAELEQYANKAVCDGKKYIALRMNGDPCSARQRLLGHSRGPYGRVYGWQGSDNLVSFDPLAVLRYLDKLPVSVLSGDDDVACEAVTPDTLALEN